MVKYKNIKGDIKTFDIFLFSGRGKFSAVIECTSSSKYSHVGIAVNGRDLEKMEFRPKYAFDPDGLYLFHSNKGSVDGTIDIFSGEDASGVQINSLGSVLSNYNGKCFYRPLTLKHDRSHYLKKLGEVIRRNIGKPYEDSFIELCFALFPCNCQSTDTDTIFCSELVAEVYIDTGIFTEDSDDSNNYTPVDFSEEVECLPFAHGNGLGNESVVKY
jgi:hypothetical protein